jgi:hypothetical protein
MSVAVDRSLRYPTTGIVCCARAASGHAAAPQTTVMNSRRRIRASDIQADGNGSNRGFGRATHVRFGSKADMCSAQADVRYEPKADIAKKTAS